jgi:uncharacterized Zn finger protein
MRESAHDKGRRLLTEGRLRILDINEESVAAHCMGDGAELYRVGFANGAWHCGCPAVGRCAHLVALQLVVLRPAAGAAT